MGVKVIVLVFGALMGTFSFLGKDSHLVQAPSIEPSQVAKLEQRQAKFHYPTVEGVKVKATPYLTLPFRKEDAPTYDITEGWMYSKTEQDIHGQDFHGGIDFVVPYGTPVVAPCDGYAVASYWTFWVKDNEGLVKLYKGKPIHLGYGYFVEIYNPEAKRLVLLGHLSELDPTIPFLPPQKEADGWKPELEKLTADELLHSTTAVKIKKGQPLGKVGVSGLALGESEEYQGELPLSLEAWRHESWDEPHLHLEELWRLQSSPTGTEKIGDRAWMRDPYAIYSDNAQDYPTPSRRRAFGKDPLFLLSPYGLPKYADE